jgi:hypothetical protein
MMEVFYTLKLQKYFKIPNSAFPCLTTNASSGHTLLSSLLIATHFLLLGWFHFLLAVFNHKYPRALTTSTSWGYQDNPDFAFRANGISGPHAGTTLAHTWPQELSFIMRERDSIAIFLQSSTPVLKHMAEAPMFCCLLDMGPSFNYIFASFLFSMISFIA